MIELTAAQIADGWIAHDPAAQGAKKPLDAGGEFEVLFRNGANGSSWNVTVWNTDIADYAQIVAYRIRGRGIALTSLNAENTLVGGRIEFPDANADMLARDLPRTYDVDALAGNGMIFGTPKVEKCNLLTVAEITSTGRSYWSAE